LAEDKGGAEVVEEKTIVFYEDELIAVKMEDGSIYVPVVRLCENLGISWPAQFERINRHNALADTVKTIRVTRMVNGERGGGAVGTVCLPLDMVPGWLFGVQASRVKEEIRPKLDRYQRECFRVLWDAFKGDMLPELQEPKTDLTPAEQTLVHVEALYNLARNQVAMERWLMHHDRRLEEVEEVVEDLRLRVQGPDRLIGEEQRAELANAVKAVAYALTQRDRSRNWYQSIYGEMYRRFKVSSYKQVPMAKFGEVMAWLKEFEEQLG
jgi:hypothetical protein